MAGDCMSVDRMCYPNSHWWERLAARIVARMLLRHVSFQCGGRVNWLVPEHKHDVFTASYQGGADVQVDATQLAHWVLRTAGYNVCEMDIIERKAP